MANLTYDLGRCALLCQAIESYFFLIVSDFGEDRSCDVNSHIQSTVNTWVQNWNRTKKALINKSHEGLTEHLLDEYAIKRNWVLHNSIIDSVLLYKEYNEIDITEYVNYFEIMAEYFHGIAKYFTDLDLVRDTGKEEKLEIIYSKMLSRVLRNKKKIEQGGEING